MTFRALTLGMALAVLAAPLAVAARDSAWAQPDPGSTTAPDTAPDDANLPSAPDTDDMSAQSDSATPRETDANPPAEVPASAPPVAAAPPVMVAPVTRHAPITTNATPSPK